MTTDEPCFHVINKRLVYVTMSAVDCTLYYLEMYGKLNERAFI